MNVLIDTNVVLDMLLRREPFYRHSSIVLLLSEKHYLDGFVSASAITDIFYILRKELKDKKQARLLLKRLLQIVRVAAVDSNIISEAVDSEWEDFEDSVQYFAGKILPAEYIITRDINGYIESGITIITPQNFLESVINQQ